MAKSLDSNIYGSDDTGFATRVASESLQTSSGEVEDYWGDEQDDRAQAKGNVGRESTGPSDPDTPVRRGLGADRRQDKEKLDMSADWPNGEKHRKGPSTSRDTNQDWPSVPSNQTATRKGGSPKP